MDFCILVVLDYCSELLFNSKWMELICLCETFPFLREKCFFPWFFQTTKVN